MTAIAPSPIQDRPDEHRAIDAIVRAFAADPVIRWCWPDARQYERAMPAFTQAFAGRAFAARSAFCTVDYAGAALWLPPGETSDDEAVVAVLAQTVEADVLHDLFGVFGQMGTHHPAEPHWYLPLIGVDPAAQSQGLGSLLLRHSLEHCDREGHVAYLEATSVRNVPLYQRHGFVALGVIQQGGSPPLVPMRRDPRPIASAVRRSA